MSEETKLNLTFSDSTSLKKGNRTDQWLESIIDTGAGSYRTLTLLLTNRFSSYTGMLMSFFKSSRENGKAFRGKFIHKAILRSVFRYCRVSET